MVRAQSLALLAGVMFLVVGAVRFEDSSTLLNAVHFASGAVGIAAARAQDTARTFLVAAGVAYLVLWLLGVGGAGGWVPLDVTDNWFHLVLGVAAVALSGAPRRL